MVYPYFLNRVARELAVLCSEGDFTEEKITESALKAGYKRQFPAASWILDDTLVAAVNEAKKILAKDNTIKDIERAL